MKKLLLTVLIGLPLFITSIYPVKATTYTTADVAKHNTVSDCWMIFEGKVYDLSASHLNNHADKYMDISSWCGMDMTTDFKSKAGQGQDHSSRVYSDLNNYYIGDVGASSTTTNTGTTGTDTTGTNTDTTTGTTTDTTTTTPVVHPTASESERENPYNFWAPALISFFGYMGYWWATKVGALKKFKLFNKHTFNLTFNTLMLIGLIPSAGFGVFMIARYSLSDLSKIHFDFLYWHVEFSVALSVFMVTHFLTRFRLYKAPLNLFRRRKVANIQTPQQSV
jgi:cytochrome b involved in lipid metabolism